MSNSNNDGLSCSTTCWALAALMGVLLAILLLVFGNYTLVPALIIGAIAFVVGGFVFNWAFCQDAKGVAVAAGSAAAGAATVAVATPPKPAAPSAPVEATTPAPLVSTPTPVKAEAKKAPAKKAPAKKAAPKAKAAAKPAAKAAPKAAVKKPAAKKATGPKLFKKAPAKVDDLKLISGVGPKLEETLHDIGIYQYAQVADWKKADIGFVDDRLKFKGRIERDGWVKQAKVLAKGGQTEFSKRKTKG
jgi:predicted flap endonuclease-1-like 5' DNA nuclease